MARALQELLTESLEVAGPAIKATFGPEERHLTPDEFRSFWRSTRMWAVATNGRNSAPHIAPVHVLLTDDDKLEMAIFEDSVRLRDLRRDPRIAITGWGEEGIVAIVYGRATEVEDTRRPVNAGGRPENSRHVLTMRIEMDRVYAMRPRRQAAGA